MVSWQNYEVYSPLTTGPLSRMSRADARQSFDDAMAKKHRSLAMLEQFARANSAPFGYDRRSADAFGAWFIQNVEPDPDLPDRLKDHWYSVVFDMGFWVGELIIREFPELGWKFHSGGRTHISYQKHVIGGYRSDPKYVRDPDRYVAGLAHRAITGKSSNESPIWFYVDHSKPNGG